MPKQERLDSPVILHYFVVRGIEKRILSRINRAENGDVYDFMLFFIWPS